MDDRTGEIITTDELSAKDKREQRHYVPLTDEQYRAAQGMNRKERRALARKIRRERKRQAPEGREAQG